jgi:hypothetical protein
LLTEYLLDDYDMNSISRIVSSIIFCVQVFLSFLFLFETHIILPPILQVVGRLHPMVLHIPIGATLLMAMLLLLNGPLRNDQQEHHALLHRCLVFISLSSSMAALFGFFLSLQPGYEGDTLFLHKVGGIVLSWLCYGMLVFHLKMKRQWMLIAVGCFIGLMVGVGHTGSILTHGENFIGEPLAKPEIKRTAENASVYEFAILPILEKKCISCHNENKAKGKLIITDPKRFREGGEHGAAFEPGNPEHSLMIQSLYLPLEHKEHMPPKGKAQLNAIEISLLEQWIRSGADFTSRLQDLSPDDSLAMLVRDAFVITSSAMKERTYSFKAASKEVIENVNTPFVTVTPLYQKSPALQANFFVPNAYKQSTLQQLTAVEKQLVALNLSKMPVEDKALSIIAGFENLEVLNLNFTPISASALTVLGRLKNLQQLSLAGTATTATSLHPVLVLPNLREIYLWNTQVTVNQKDSIEQAYPTIKIILTNYHDESVLKLNKPMLVNEGMVYSTEPIVLKHSLAKVNIYYTLDGSSPDTIHGLRYEQALYFHETTTIKAIACKPGWHCSDLFEATCTVKDKILD